MVLFQLSQDGWVNPKNERAIQELERRGLVASLRGFHIMNESFRRFIRANQYPEEIAMWEEETRQSVWNGFRKALIGAGVLIVAWLVFTQQQTVHLAFGYVGAIGGAAATVGTLLGALRGHNTKNAPPGAEPA